MENLILSLSCVTPMFLILCVGMLARRFRFVTEDSVHDLSTLSFRALLPCLMFHNLYSADLQTAVRPRIMVFLLLWTLGWFLLNYVIYSRTIPLPQRRGAFIQNAFRSNIAVIGVSLARSMMDDSWVAAISMSISMLVPLYNILAVITLETCRGGTVDLRKTLRGIVTNPLVLGCALGFACLVLQVRLPEPVERAVNSLGSAGSVTTMLALGASFQFGGLRKNWKTAALCSVIRLIVAPLLSLTAAVALGFRNEALGIILICTAAPTATTSYPMALAYGSDHELTGQLVVTTSLFCSLTLFLWIFGLKQLGLM